MNNRKVQPEVSAQCGGTWGREETIEDGPHRVTLLICNGGCSSGWLLVDSQSWGFWNTTRASTAFRWALEERFTDNLERNHAS